jgi:inorganic pyrophosphatase
LLAEIEHFFAVYKDLEDKKVETHGFRDLEAALMIIGEARQRAGGKAHP